jgi:hypothetical protein
MRTGIYVHVTSTLSIVTSEDEIVTPEDGLRLIQMVVPGKGKAPVEVRISDLGVTNKLSLEPGVYLVRSRLPVGVTAESETYFEVVIMSDDKSKWPDPNAHVTALVPDANAEMFDPFFNGGKGIAEWLMNGMSTESATPMPQAAHELER